MKTFEHKKSETLNAKSFGINGYRDIQRITKSRINEKKFQRFKNKINRQVFSDSENNKQIQLNTGKLYPKKSLDINYINFLFHRSKSDIN